MDKNLKTRKIKDGILNAITYVFSSFGMVILILLIAFIFKNGVKNLSWKMLTSDYFETPYFATCEVTSTTNFHLENKTDVFYSKVWGIGLKNSKDLSNHDVIEIVYIDNLSPFKNAKDKSKGTHLEVKEGQVIKRIQIENKDGTISVVTPKYKAEGIALALDNGIKVREFYYSTIGGGIRGSLLTTIYLIILTLLIALPIGILAAIYLAQYAPQNKFTNLIRSFIDMTSGIPSIIFGLMGMIIFIPIVSKITNTSGGSIISGALTLSVMLLPIIIRTTEEAIHSIPKDYTSASLALGASETQTTFKVILPNAIPGILTATLLSIGRIIGESAALIFAIGTAIKDKILLTGSSTSLAVHIWTVISGENPNFEHACAISIVILLVVFILNIFVKLISKKINRYEVK